MSNGRLTSTALGFIPGTSHRVLKTLVPQTAALRAAFEKRFGKPLTLTDSYRPYEVQERIFRERYTAGRVTGIDPRYWNGKTWWRLPGKAAAAVPGTSNHGWGQAIDWASNVNRGGSAEHTWMVDNAPRFGWAWPSWARRAVTYEPWHFEATPVPVSKYRDYLSQNRITVPGLDLPDPLTPEDDMPYTPDELRAQVRQAIAEYVLEVGERDTKFGRQAGAGWDFAFRRLAHYLTNGAIGGGDPTWRQIRNATWALTRADVDEAALAKDVAAALVPEVVGPVVAAIVARPEVGLSEVELTETVEAALKNVLRGGVDGR